MSSETQKILTTDGIPLEVSLRKVERRNKLKAFLLVAPLLFFLLIVYISPIFGMLFNSVDDRMVTNALPKTFKAMEDWDGKELPPEKVFEAFHFDFQKLIEEEREGKLSTQLNYTKNGFDVVDIPHDLWQRMRDRLHEQLPKARRESDVQGIYGDERPRMVGHGEGRNLLSELQPILERWVPDIETGLQPVTAYGMRAYGRGASLGFHTDRVDTHVISAIVHVDHKYDDDSEPWPIEIEGHDGLRHSVDLKPGQMLLYESAKCPHGRSTALKGDWYASVFVHYCVPYCACSMA